MDAILDASFRNFHAKGLDYLCLKRTPDHTIKVYFFDGDADLSALPEIVMPHDHRYDFRTTCIAGEVVNREQARCAEFAGAERYEEFAWDTPLLGGSGFTHVGGAWLTRPRSSLYRPGDRWESAAQTIHTLQIVRAGTIVRLDQYRDLLPQGVPTSTFRLAAQRGDIRPPELAGLYDRMTTDYAAKRMRQFEDAITSQGGPDHG